MRLAVEALATGLDQSALDCKRQSHTSAWCTRAAEDEVPAWRELVQSGAAFTLPNQEMRLLRGPLAAIEEFYELHRQPSNLWWPEDRAWCVGTDVDLMSTYVGGSSASIGAVLADDRLESLPVSVDQSVTWESDTINPQPAPP